MRKILAIFALCLFGFYGAMQGQALAGVADRKASIGEEKSPRITVAQPDPEKSGDVKGGPGVKKP